MNEVWIVRGSKWDLDHKDDISCKFGLEWWVVAAYPAEDVAKFHVDLANSTLIGHCYWSHDRKTKVIETFWLDCLSHSKLSPGNLLYECVRVDYYHSEQPSNKVWLVGGSFDHPKELVTWGEAVFPCEEVAKDHETFLKRPFKEKWSIPKRAEFAEQFNLPNYLVEGMCYGYVGFHCFCVDFALHPDQLLERRGL